MTVDLNDPLERSKLAKRIKDDVDEFSVNEFSEDPRTHLGASIIGHDCAAYAWSVFRWLRFEKFDGRMYRLFNRGHEEETRFVRWLRGIGFDVREVDPETEKQFRIVGSQGHFGGSLDGMCKAPARYNLPHWLILLNEFKTHNAKSFRKLVKDGVQKAKPQHYRQMCSYGRAYNFEFGLYCAVNKDDDDLYFEVVKLDFRQADDLFRKADGIVFAKTRPPKIAQTEAFYECKTCDFVGLCHRGEAPMKNCRSCEHAVPIENAQWFCQVHNGVIPPDFIIQGCDSWRRIA